MAFKTIETQEEFDSMVRDRIDRAKESVKKQFEGYASPEEVENLKKDYEGQLETRKNYLSPEEVKTLESKYTSQINALKLDQIRVKVAQKNKLPVELANRLQGTNEEELQKDAETIVSFMPKDSWPGKQTEPPVGGDESKVKELLNQFRED